MHIQLNNLTAKVNQFVLVGEETNLPHQHRKLSQDGSYRRSLNAPTQHEDKDRGKHTVENDRAKGGIHRLLRTVGRTQHGIQT